MIRTSRTAESVKVTFALPLDLTAGRCSVVGDFNEWLPGTHELRRRGNGTRSASVTVPRAPACGSATSARTETGSTTRTSPTRTGRTPWSSSDRDCTAADRCRRGAVGEPGWRGHGPERACGRPRRRHVISAHQARGGRRRRGRRHLGTRATRRRRDHAGVPDGRARPCARTSGIRSAAGHDCAPRGRDPTATRPGRAVRCRRAGASTSPSYRRTWSRATTAWSWSTAAGDVARGRGARGAARPAPVVGLDDPALRLGIRGLVGHRGPRRSARVRRLDRPRARGRGRAAQPAARGDARAAGAAVAVHPVEQAVRDAARVAGDRPGSLPHGGRGRPRPGGRAPSGHRRRPHRPRPGLGGEALRVRAAVELRRTARADRCRRRPLAVRDLLRARRAVRRTVEPVAGGVAAPGRARGRRRAQGAGVPRRVPRVAAGSRAGAAGGGAGDGAGGRGARRARPRRRDATRRGPTRGPCRTCSRWACTSVRRRTRSASRARTGACRRGARTGWTPRAMPRTGTCCAPSCGRRTGCASTTSPGCGGCGGSHPASPRTAARTCTTTPT